MRSFSVQLVVLVGARDYRVLVLGRLQQRLGRHPVYLPLAEWAFIEVFVSAVHILRPQHACLTSLRAVMASALTSWERVVEATTLRRLPLFHGVGGVRTVDGVPRAQIRVAQRIEVRVTLRVTTRRADNTLFAIELAWLAPHFFSFVLLLLQTPNPPSEVTCVRSTVSLLTIRFLDAARDPTEKKCYVYKCLPLSLFPWCFSSKREFGRRHQMKRRGIDKENKPTEQVYRMGSKSQKTTSSRPST